jgi:hypothetical protein
MHNGIWQTKPPTGVNSGSDGLYVLQLNADGLEDQKEMIGAATDVIDSQTTITP